MKPIATLLLLWFGILTAGAQIAKDITTLETPVLDETSGLLFYNNTLITHTDSGGKAELYEINATTGAITRTVDITNATNVDWEDIAQDTAYIYIGDIGNNSGNRTDLKIYKVSKADYDTSDGKVTAEIISYSYADQLDFTHSPNMTNWDAEGLISYGDRLLIFTKNWVDLKTNVYAIPKTSGTHSAVLVSSYNTNGLITGADSSPDEEVIYLIGYSTSEAPFMYTIHDIPENSLDIFSGKISDKIVDIVSLGYQVEGIALFDMTPTTDRLYLSNEKFSASLGPIKIKVPAKLLGIEIDAQTLNSVVPNTTLNPSSKPR
ncbi:T9SS C-terminal target domain-containing protein [Gelidibacter japonicus]|uniref:T9SS C-terminal target domain-containing protein n=1 Tax=Gelidibacter japonicus TaxID=1962232 RepID=UPI0020222BBC|nr:T9SS C-terminal target domain-containing protein [Gelidibacter japonicus]MCL8008948.1 T9SS C-terminal target domain-containing protein [Gelidibacter japonicus]